MIAKVILNNKEQNIDRIFDYVIPQSLEDRLCVGMRVSVPFGRSNRKVDGVVVEISEASEYKNLKEISGIIGKEPVCSPWILELCLWISKKYFCSLYQAIRLAMPPGTMSGVSEKNIKIASLIISRDDAFGVAEELRQKGATAQAKIIEALVMSDCLPVSKLVREKGGSYDAVKSLEKKGFIAVDSQQVERKAYDENKYTKTVAYKPTDEQKTIIDYFSLL